MIQTAKKRKLSSLEDHPANSEAPSPVKRRSPRNKSPQKTSLKPTGSPVKYSCKSPRKPAVLTSSFYGKLKTPYLTPLERKALKESLPAHPPAHLRKSPEKTKVKEAKRPVGSNKVRKMGFKSDAKSAKRIKLPKFNRRPDLLPKTIPIPSSKPVELRKQFSFSFSKPKPKIQVGAAFFDTGKKPKSMYKKTTSRSSSKPARTTGHPQTTSDGIRVKPNPPQKVNVTTSKPPEVPVLPTETKVYYQKADILTKICPTDEDDSGVDFSMSQVLTKFGIDRDLKIVLSRVPSPCQTTSLSSLEEAETETDAVSVSSAEESPTRTSPIKPQTMAVYPIFGSASKSTSSGSASSSPTYSAKEKNARRKKEKQNGDQLIIDAGQKQFGATTCSTCGMVYSADNPDDHFQHAQFHKGLLDSIKYIRWKEERVVAQFFDGKIVLVLPDDPKFVVKKVESIRRVVDNELGFQQVSLSQPMRAKTYLFISLEQQVLGCLIAEPVKQAYRVLRQSDQIVNSAMDDLMKPNQAWCCSSVPEKALCGISRIWVFSLARRRGIATRLLDTARATFLFWPRIAKEEIAFSDPTNDGKLFATRYSNTPTFLVYNFTG